MGRLGGLRPRKERYTEACEQQPTYPYSTHGVEPNLRLAKERNNFTQYSYKRNNVVTIAVLTLSRHRYQGVLGLATIGALSDWSQANPRRRLDVKLVVRAMDTADPIPEVQHSSGGLHKVSGTAAVSG